MSESVPIRDCDYWFKPIDEVNKQQSGTLANLRNTLQRKLLSREIQISNHTDQ